MERDLDEMNGLIGQATELGKRLGRGDPRWVDLAKLLGDLCQGNPRLKWEPARSCRHRVDPLALRRIVGNLLENALRYSQDQVEVRLLRGGAIDPGGAAVPEGRRPIFGCRSHQQPRTDGPGPAPQVQPIVLSPDVVGPAADVDELLQTQPAEAQPLPERRGSDKPGAGKFIHGDHFPVPGSPGVVVV
jgi:signal transduction histidine kinase